MGEKQADTVYEGVSVLDPKDGNIPVVAWRLENPSFTVELDEDGSPNPLVTAWVRHYSTQVPMGSGEEVITKAKQYVLRGLSGMDVRSEPNKSVTAEALAEALAENKEALAENKDAWTATNPSAAWMEWPPDESDRFRAMAFVHGTKKAWSLYSGGNPMADEDANMLLQVIPSTWAPHQAV